MSLKSRLALRLPLGIVVAGAIFFIPAGSFRFWQAWVFLMIWFVPSVCAFIYFYKHDLQLIERRATEEGKNSRTEADHQVRFRNLVGRFFASRI